MAHGKFVNPSDHQDYVKGGTYECRSCGKRTRDTGKAAEQYSLSESESELCFKCLEREAWINYIADGVITPDDPEIPVHLRELCRQTAESLS